MSANGLHVSDTAVSATLPFGLTKPVIAPQADEPAEERSGPDAREKSGGLAATEAFASWSPGTRLGMALDVAAALGALFATVLVTNVDQMPVGGVDAFLSMRITLKNVLLLLLFASVWPLVFGITGLYRARRIRRTHEEAARVFAGCALGAVVAVGFAVTSRGDFRFADVGLFWAIATAATLTLRGLRRALLAGKRHLRRVLVVGSGARALRASRELMLQSELPCEIVGFVDTSDRRGPIEYPTIGTLESLEQLLMRQPIDEVFIALPVKSRYHDIQETLRICERVGIQASYDAALFHTPLARPRWDGPGDRPVVRLQVAPEGYSLLLKRTLDIALAVAAIVVLAPVMLTIAVAIKVTSRGPAIYAQERYGFNKRRFRMFKFRTMIADADQLQATLEARNEADGPVFKIADDPRITPLGRLLRKTSLDELPQFFNVLRGDMSVVGPRPLPLRDVGRFTRSSDVRRFSMLPGITGLWQVSGRSTLSFDEWIRLDLQYIDRWSLGLDLRILALTVPAVVRGTGAN